MPSGRRSSNGRATACRPIPRAWLVSTGRFKAIDGMRRRARFDALDEDAAETLDTRRDDRGKRDRRGHRGRPAAADLHLLPPGAAAGRAGGADAARSVRPHDRGDRARLPHAARPRSRSASCAPRRRSATRTFPYQVPSPDGSARPARQRAARDLPGVQRRLLGVVGRVADAARSLGRGDPPGAAARRAAAGARGDRAAGADAAARIAARGAHVAVRAT